ncbi:MAG TPA: hypothetical protein VK403_00675 [Allosphingosinicella sp.]|nr:hypothetical protein [Allosphingosinicella sp.]
MESWIYRIMAARNPDWRSLSGEPMTAANGGLRTNATTRREK